MTNQDLIRKLKAQRKAGTGFQVVLQITCVTTEEDLNHPAWGIIWYRRGIPNHRLYGRKRDYATMLEAEAAALGFIQTRQALKGAVIEISDEDRALGKKDIDQQNQGDDPLA